MSQAKTTETMDRLTHTPTTNDVYKDARNGTLKRIYIDSEIVFTRSEKTKRNRNRHVHNMMDVDTLKNRIDQDRLEHYTTYSDVKSASSDELINLKGIGEKAAKNLKTHVENA